MHFFKIKTFIELLNEYRNNSNREDLHALIELYQQYLDSVKIQMTEEEKKLYDEALKTYREIIK
jgi:hypothetical protein